MFEKIRNDVFCHFHFVLPVIIFALIFSAGCDRENPLNADDADMLVLDDSNVVLGTFAAPSASSQSAFLESGDHNFSLSHDGLTRTYIVHMPPQATSGQSLPVVLNFHGGASNAENLQAYTRMDRLADQEGFIVVYPNGTGRYNRAYTWNAGNCCGSARLNNIDDVGFVLQLLDNLAQQTPIDQTRIYATGMSNGAQLAYRLAVEVSDRIAAVAGVAGTMQVEVFAPTQSVPVMHIHSVDDPREPYFPYAEETVTEWVAFDQCTDEPTIAAVLIGEGVDEGHSAQKSVYGFGNDGSEVVLWALSGPGHVWPGGLRITTSQLGTPTNIIDANTEIWNFFSRF